MMNDLKRALGRAAEANRKRVAAAHREVVMQEEANRAADVRQNMVRLKELRLLKEAQETRTKICKANQPTWPKPKQRSK